MMSGCFLLCFLTMLFEVGAALAESTDPNQKWIVVSAVQKIPAGSLITNKMVQETAVVKKGLSYSMLHSRQECLYRTTANPIEEGQILLKSDLRLVHRNCLLSVLAHAHRNGTTIVLTRHAILAGSTIRKQDLRQKLVDPYDADQYSIANKRIAIGRKSKIAIRSGQALTSLMLDDK